MKVSNGNAHTGNAGVTPHATLHRRPALLIAEPGGNDTESSDCSTIDSERMENRKRMPIAIVPSGDTETGSVNGSAIASVDESIRNRDDASTGARDDASQHARRMGYALLVCCTAWTACSAMGADFGIVNGATGQGAATLAAFIVTAAIVKKAIARR